MECFIWFSESDSVHIFQIHDMEFEYLEEQLLLIR